MNMVQINTILEGNIFENANFVCNYNNQYMKKIGLVGAGTMGLGIALAASQSGCDVLIFESNESAQLRARQNIQKHFDKEQARNKLDSAAATEQMSRLHFVRSVKELFTCEIVIEAIIEELAVKRELFKELSSIVSESCILATNTSSLSISALASGVSHPERFVGIHFFNPAYLMKLVEIIPAIQTSQNTIELSKDLLSRCKKISVVAKDTPGFIVNRIARPYYGEALRIFEEGLSRPEDIDFAMTQAGFKMGPFALMDFIGHDINYHVTEIVYNSFYQDPRYRPSLTQKRLVDAGFLGVKSGRGFYLYGEQAIMPSPSIDPASAKVISDRIITMLINEAADALYLQIASLEDIELSMTRGVNYPKGLLAWADEIGIEEIVCRIDVLFDTYHDMRYRCSSLLRNMARQKKKFYT